jgi:H/ACA ribonucleoprotein complex subunit 3
VTTSDIRVCADWRDHHDRPVYTLSETCPDCGNDAVQSSPARYNPEDPHGEYRRRAKARRRDRD